MSNMENKKSILSETILKLSSLTKKPYYKENWKKFYEDVKPILGENLFSDVYTSFQDIENLKQNEHNLSFTSSTLELIQQINLEISSLKKLEEVLNVSAKRLKDVSKAHIIFVFLIDEKKLPNYIIKAVAGASAQKYLGYTLDIRNSVFEKTINDKEIFIIDKFNESPIELDVFSKYIAENEGIQSSIYSPIILNDRCTGVLVLSRKVPYPSTKAHIKMLSQYCQHLAIVMENSRLYTKELQISNLNQQVLDATLDEGYANTVQRLEKIINSPILLVDENGNTIYKTDSTKPYHTYQYILKFQMEIVQLILSMSFDRLQRKSHRLRNGKVLTIFPIVLKNKNVGFLIIPRVFDDRDDLDILAIEQFKNVIALKINQEKSITEMELSLKRDYLYELLLGLETEENLYRKGRFLTFNFEEPHKIIVLRLNKLAHDITDLVLEKIRNRMDIASVEFNMIHNNKFVVISHEEDAKKLARKLLELHDSLYPDYTATIGISNIVITPNDYVNGYWEAKKACEFGLHFDTNQKEVHFDDLGIVGMLLQADHVERISRFKEKYLNKLIQYDLESNTDLINTLKVYLENESVIQSSAKVLFVHYNTLRNRIKRIEEILELDLNDSQTKLNLRIALIIHKLVSN